MHPPYEAPLAWGRKTSNGRAIFRTRYGAGKRPVPAIQRYIKMCLNQYVNMAGKLYHQLYHPPVQPLTPHHNATTSANSAQTVPTTTPKTRPTTPPSWTLTHRTVPCFAAGLCVCVFVSRGPGTSAPFVGADVWGRSRLDSCRCSECCVVSVLPVVRALQLWVPLYSGSAGWGRSGAVVSSCLVDHACRCPQCPAFGTWGGWVVVVCWCGLVWGLSAGFSSGGFLGGFPASARRRFTHR